MDGIMEGLVDGMNKAVSCSKRKVFVTGYSAVFRCNVCGLEVLSTVSAGRRGTGAKRLAVIGVVEGDSMIIGRIG